MIGDIYKKGKNNSSSYKPSKEIADFTAIVQKDYGLGHNILTRQWTELNDRTVIEDENRGALMFNAFVETGVDDPGEAWKWRGTRSRARNKGIAMHAQLTANYLLPLFVAQNDDDETDRDFSEVMRDGVEWMTLSTNSDYQPAFLQVVFGMLTNPVTYLSAEFCQVMQTIRERQEDGSIKKKEVIDEVLSGYHAPIYSSTQVMITNAFQRNMQKQRTVIKRKFIEYSEAEAKYSKHPNWMYVKPGWNTVYNQEDGLFYDIKDTNHPFLVEECVYMNRRDDTEVPFLGGIFLGEDDLESNPMLHRDNRDAPKYNLVPFGYSRIGEHFFFYKSMMNVVGWDNDLYDAMSEITMNRALLEVDMPIAVTGADGDFDSDIVFPKAVIAFESKDTKVTPLMPPANLAAGFNALSATEASMDQETLSPISSGMMPPGRQQAYVVATVQQNAQKIISGVGKSLAESMAWYGDLMKDIFINHFTVPQVEDITGGGMRLKYRSFMLENKETGGRMMNKQIKFDDSLVGAEMSDDELQGEHLKLLETTGYPDEKHAIIRVNPEMFARFKYLSRIDLQELIHKNSEYWKPLLTNLYTMLRQDPLVDTEWLLRKLSYAYFNSEGDGLIKKNPQASAGGPPQAGGDGAPQPPTGQNQLGQMAQGKALSTALGGNNALHV